MVPELVCMMFRNQSDTPWSWNRITSATPPRPPLSFTVVHAK